MTFGNNRDLSMVPPGLLSGIIPSGKRGETRSADLWDFRICSSFLVMVVVIVVILRVCPAGAGCSAAWPVLGPVATLLLAVSRRSYLRYIRVRHV